MEMEITTITIIGIETEIITEIIETIIIIEIIIIETIIITTTIIETETKDNKEAILCQVTIVTSTGSETIRNTILTGET